MSIAVIVTTFNSSGVVSDALASLANQARLPDEVLVVDDGSTDDTKALVEAWGKKQPFPVCFIRNEFSHSGFPTPGPAGSRTTGIHHAGADLIAILDHDDMMLPSHLRLCEEALAQNPSLELVFGDAVEFCETDPGITLPSFFAGRRIEQIPFEVWNAQGLRLLTEELLPHLIFGSFIPTGGNMWRRRTALLIGGFDRRAGGSDDVVFFSTLSRHGRVAYYPFPITKRRIHSDNMSHPRHALRHSWDHINLLALIQRKAQELRLTAEELSTLENLMQEIGSQVLYHASRNGISVYIDFKKRMGRLARTRPKDVLRAVAFTGRNAEDLKLVPAHTRHQVVGSPEVEISARDTKARGATAGG